ncbi:MAG: Gfo/Idh/MocA family oxidoreductase [Planctomycetales bacterium]|nr:Gfo/Idh/MocA family oxidoreductase [Planctomycetales bacterium]
MQRITMLGAGLIGMFYTMSLHGRRSRDRVEVVYSRTAERARNFANEWGIPRHTDQLAEAINDPDTDVVVVALPNHLHEEAVTLAAEAGKAVFCTKPLGRNAAEARRMLEVVERTGVYHAYLEDLVYTPKTLKALKAVQSGSVGKVLWVRSRETHPGPHSDWFWNRELSGGGAIIDLGCHCVEIARNFIGKEIRPLEVSCWADTQVHPIDAEDHAVGLVRYENGAIGQFEVSWAFRGGMDLRDEVAGTEGTIWLNHWMRTGMELYTAVGEAGYVAEKADSDKGWLFPVGDEPGALGYHDMFADALDCLEQGREPMESFYDGYVVNAIIDAAYESARSKQWSPVELPTWRGKSNVESLSVARDFDDDHLLIKSERMPDGSEKLILRHKQSGEVSQRIVRK